MQTKENKNPLFSNEWVTTTDVNQLVCSGLDKNQKQLWADHAKDELCNQM